MDADRFDSLTQSLSDPASRRTVVGAALTGVMGTFGLDTTEAKKKKKRKKCKPRCAGKACGPNGCPKGDCGACTGGKVCNFLGQCVGCRVGSDCAPVACQDANCVDETCEFSDVPDNTNCDSGVCCAGKRELLPFCT